MVSFASVVSSLEKVSAPLHLSMDGKVMAMDGEVARMDDFTGGFDKVIDRLEKV